MLRLNCFFQAKEGRLDAALGAAKELTAASLKQDGCIAYDVLFLDYLVIVCYVDSIPFFGMALLWARARGLRFAVAFFVVIGM